MLMFVLLIIAHDIYISLPCAGVSVFFAAAAYSMFRLSVSGEYAVVSGICQSVALTPIRGRVKNIILQSGEHTLLITLHGRFGTIWAGTAVDLYAAKNTPIYEKNGVQILYNYLAIDVKQMGRKVNGVYLR